MPISHADKEQLERIAKQHSNKLPEGTSDSPAGVANNTRFRVASTPAVTTQEPDDLKEDVVVHFNKLLGENPVLSNTFLSLAMVIRVIRNSYRLNITVIDDLGFNRDNLERLLEAVFSQAKGKEVTPGAISDYLTFFEREVSEVMFYDLLGLTDDSTPEEIEQCCLTFAERFKKLDELIRYPYHRDIVEALRKIEDNKKPNVKPADIVESYKLKGVGKIFEVEDIETMIKEVKDGKIAPLSELSAVKDNKITDLSGASPITLEFYSINSTEPFFLAFKLIWEALKTSDTVFESRFQEQYFKGDDKATVVEKLNSALLGLGNVLKASAEGKDRMVDFLEELFSSLGMKSVDEIEVTMRDYYLTISDHYIDVLDQKDPIRMGRELPEKFLKPADGNKTNDFLSHLFKALKKDETKYKESYQESFGGMERSELVAAITAATRDPKSSEATSIGQIMIEAITYADEKYDNAYYPAQVFSEVIAEAFSIEDYELLKKTVMNVTMILRKRFPAVLNEAPGEKKKTKIDVSKKAREVVKKARGALKSVLDYFYKPSK